MQVAIVGSGPVGMTAGLLLARQGHQVTLTDRDPGPIPGRVWDRVGVMQFHLPHGFRHQCRDLLRERLPDVLDAVLAAGSTASVVSTPAEEPASMAPLLVRRSVFERAVWEVTSTEPGLSRLTGHADGVEIDQGRVAGVVVDSGLVPADLVVDASGRSGRLSQASRPLGQRVDCGMAYAARQYRLRPGAEPGPRNGGPAFISQHLGFTTLVFEHDAGTFTVLFVRPSDDRTLALLRHTTAFEAACRAVPGVADWTDVARSEPIDVVRAGAGLTNEYRDQPFVAGLVAIGDALCVTNPLGARGIVLGLQSAVMVADLVADEPTDDLAGRLGSWARAHTQPWFHDHLEWDAAVLGTWSGSPIDPDGPIGPEALVAAAQHHHPEWMATLGPYLGMISGPDALTPLREQVREMIRDGWQPAATDALSRNQLAELITQLNAATPVSA